MAAPNIVQTPMTFASMYPLKAAGMGLRKTYFPVTLAGLLGTAKVVDNYTFDCNGRITNIEYVSTVPASAASKAATLTPSLDGVNLTGGVLNLTTALAVAGAVVPATPITGLNVFTPTSQFDLTLSAVTAFTEGSGVLEVTWYNTDEIYIAAQRNMMFG